MINKEVSIKDVAKYAGVSPTTVSRVINNSDHPVNPKTKAVVKKAIAELNYQPNRMAQGLKNNKSNIIGVIVHDISDEYFAELLKGIEKITFEEDYIINIFNTERDINKEIKSVKLLKANRAEAVIFTGSSLLDEFYLKEMEQQIKDLKSQDCCIISVTSHPFAITNIGIDNQEISYKATRYLFEKGHQRVVYINGPELLKTTEERLNGFSQALKEEGLSLNDSLIFTGDFSFAGGRKAALKILEHIDEITGIVAANDETALGLIWELRQHGINVPANISVVGIGNIPASRYSFPPLSTVSLPLFNLGEQIGNYIVDKLQGKEPGVFNLQNKTVLVERESVKIL